MVESKTTSVGAWMGSLVLPIGFLIGWRARSLRRPASNQTASLSSFLTYRYKIVLVVTPDVQLARARLAEHCAQASILAYKTSKQQTPLAYFLWSLFGSPKVVVRARSSADFETIHQQASRQMISTCLVQERSKEKGVERLTPVVMSVGPGPASIVDQITGHFKLY